MVWAGVAGALLVAGAAPAADLAVRGRRMLVHERPGAGETGRRVVVLGREGPTAEALGSIQYGAYLQVFVQGGSSQSQLFFLEPAGWTTVPRGLRYVGPGPGNPVQEVRLEAGSGKPTLVRVVLRGDVGTTPLAIVPPNPGVSGGVSISLTGGRACVVLGGAAGGTVAIDKPRRWLIRQATGEVACPPGPTPLPTPDVTPIPCDTLCNGTPTPQPPTPTPVPPTPIPCDTLCSGTPTPVPPTPTPVPPTPVPCDTLCSGTPTPP
jgi:hypothetical protein